MAPEVELSALVNYIQPVHFKSFELSESKYDLNEIELCTFCILHLQDFTVILESFEFHSPDVGLELVPGCFKYLPNIKHESFFFLVFV